MDVYMRFVAMCDLREMLRLDYPVITLPLPGQASHVRPFKGYFRQYNGMFDFLVMNKDIRNGAFTEPNSISIFNQNYNHEAFAQWIFQIRNMSEGR